MLGLGPFADQPIEQIEEQEYREALTGSSYVIGSITGGEGHEIWTEGEGFEDVYEIRLQTEDTVTLVLTQSRPTPGFDIVLLDDGGDVIARSWDASGGIKYLQTTLSPGSYRVGISFDDGRRLLASADREYALSVVIY